MSPTIGFFNCRKRKPTISTLVYVGACIANQSEPGRTFTRKTVMPFGSTLPLAHVTLSLADAT